jgi:hypothetical protein
MAKNLRSPQDGTITAVRRAPAKDRKPLAPERDFVRAQARAAAREVFDTWTSRLSDATEDRDNQPSPATQRKLKRMSPDPQRSSRDRRG